jgi:hypothetical protein
MAEEWIPYQLRFHGVTCYERGCLDGSAWDWEASFEQRFGSTILERSDPGGRLGLCNFFVQTYDDTFDVVCRSYELQLNGHMA